MTPWTGGTLLPPTVVSSMLGAHGWDRVFTATVAAFVAAGALAVVLLVRGRDRHTHIPFGPAILVGALFALLLTGAEPSPTPASD